MTNLIKNKTPRHRAREFALQGIYQWLFNNMDVHLIEIYIKEIFNFYKVDKKYFYIVLRGVINNITFLRYDLSTIIDRSINELSSIEYIVLLIGAYELKSHYEIPYKVIINEAIELVKSFGNIDGYKYVNKILDKLALNIRNIEINKNK
ncbi:transcription antitermination factor NusB [Candidatus Profftella armatura (Diaphorina cf. continua)]|uniref:Transcription antitermination protein NusB n=1 Tax=Candidatus Profftella armatura (Diaphorina cf. continua) TaxID=2661583 RepID=A0A7R7ABR0_9PROT|nr:transcription antitermination factor NusB [Candidatus Profftella armatura (Diaphorina cf. continua)]BCG49591.1 transcription antitermination factor NusB [Candidatus Profftella armatura (Diaphorina cf. continua)]